MLNSDNFTNVYCERGAACGGAQYNYASDAAADIERDRDTATATDADRNADADTDTFVSTAVRLCQLICENALNKRQTERQAER